MQNSFTALFFLWQRSKTENKKTPEFPDSLYRVYINIIIKIVFLYSKSTQEITSLNAQNEMHVAKISVL